MNWKEHDLVSISYTIIPKKAMGKAVRLKKCSKSPVLQKKDDAFPFYTWIGADVH